MEFNLRMKISAFLKDHVRRSRWHKVVTGLGCVVVFCTVYALILPAITMTRETFCGLEEHTHTEECYALSADAPQTRYSCDLKLHKHTSDCRGGKGEWVCGYADFLLHTHDELCYGEDGQLVCPLKEIEEHEHDGSCFEEEGQLICELEEDHHQHDDDCYTVTQGALICDNNGGSHIHGDSCYEEVDSEEPPAATESNSTRVRKELVCGFEEGNAHEHDEACYEQIRELTCEKEERDGHLHTEDCYEIQEVLICNQVEAVLHTHEEACWDEEGKRICGFLETEEHQHTEDCAVRVAPKGNLICELEEHTHREDCQLPEFVLMADLPGTFVDGGTIEGTEITWVVTETDSGDLTLTISGEGDIPDFASTSSTPWYYYTSQSKIPIDLVIERGITRVGTAAFQNNYFNNIQLSDTITSLGTSAFAYCYSFALSRVEIPGSVKIIGNSCFNADRTNPVEFILNEGLEEIGTLAFSRENIGTVHIPSTVKKIGGQAFRYADGYTVAEDNPYFCAEEGVLYNKDKTTLVDYPNKFGADEYRVPDTVTTIADSALANVRNVRRLYVPSTVKNITGALAQFSKYEEIYIEDGVPVNTAGSWFNGCTALTSLRLPENTPVSLGNMFANTILTDLTSFTFPNGTTSVGKLGFVNFKITGLETVRYDAANSKISEEEILGGTARFALTIGAHVDILPLNFKYFVEHATDIVFEPDNQMTIEEGAFASAPEPLAGLSGTIYVDSQGILYSYDKDAGTAAMLYCPPGITEVTIPGSITPEESVTCTVTTVKKNALKRADRLTSITFAAPEQIESLEPYALANCPSLVSVNGQTTVEEAEKIFTNAELGYSVFHRTGLTGASGSGSFEADMDGKKSLTVTCEDATGMFINVASTGKTMEWKPESEDSETGGYRILTGDVMTVTASVGNAEGEDDHLYRIYFQKTDETGSLSIQAGETYEFDGQEMVCHSTEDPNTVYLEFPHTVGGTISVPVTAVYPSPETPGGGLTVWGVIVSKEEAEENHDSLMEPADGTIQAYWTTESEPFTVEKTSTGYDPTVVGDGEGGGKPGANLTWQIKLTHGDTTNQNYGKDYASSVDYTDVMTLPAGMSWKEEVAAAIQEGNVRKSGNDILFGDMKIATISTGGGRIKWDEEQDTAVLSWTKFNPSDKAELGADTVNLTIYADALSVDVDTFVSGSTITNRVAANIHYHYSDDNEVNDEAEKPITTTSRALKLTKAGTKAAYFGEDITYTLTLTNPGVAAWTGDKAGSYTVRDELSPYSYIPLENMERMFAEPDGDKLTITINNASLSFTWEKVTGADGAESWRHPGNSDIGEGGHTITVSKEDGKYQAAVTGGDTYTGDTVEDAMRQAGYGVTHDAVYTCEWALNSPDDTPTIKGGEQRTYTINAAAKDTFQMLGADWPSSYPVNSVVNVTNSQAKMLDPENKQVAYASTVRTDVKREAVIDKRVYDADGKELTSAPAAQDGDVLEYQLDFTHYGTGKYVDLPMVDDLYGSQFLLVPIASNPDLASRNLPVYHEESYMLTEGTYENVVVGVDDEGNKLIAAAITVQEADEEADISLGGMSYSYTGLHTQIKWYFSHLESDNYRKTVTYQAIVDMELSGVNYTIGNVVWMNDKPGSRIYASLWGGGTIIDFDKQIVLEKGDSPALDVVDEDDYTAIGPGDKVLYRLTLRNTGAGNFVLHGNQLADALPQTYGVFDWEIGKNVRFVEEQHFGQTLPDFVDMDQWCIGDQYGGLIGERQYILWPEMSSITFHGVSRIYLYFELTFPENTEGADTWSQYTASNGGNMVDNTLYVYRFPSNVLHDLKEPGRVLLQKGVYSLARRDNEGSNTYKETGSNRQNYSNRETHYRSVNYYVTLYNGGNKRLYLNDLYDKLPEGFTYQQMLTNSNLNAVPLGNKTVITTIGGTSLGANPLVEMEDIDAVESKPITYRSARITVHSEGENVRFEIGPGTDAYAVKYDEEKKSYYLDHGEAIVFGYVADIGLTTETEDNATNAIAMPYTDHLGTGLTPIPKKEVSVQAPATDNYPDQNDGTRLLKNGSQVQAEYGFTGGDETWLVSDVTVERGGIIPGVTKITDSYVNSGGTKLDYTNSIMPQDTVNWKVLLHNSGTLALTDYTFTDVMPSPFAFEGLVSYTIYDVDHQAIGNPVTLMEIPKRTGSEQSLTIQDKINGNKSIEAAFDGKWHTLTKLSGADAGIDFSLNKDASDNEVLNIRFRATGGIYEGGGYVEVNLSSRNPTNTHMNAVYTNQATLTPNVQPFVNVGQGSIVQDEYGEPVSVRNFSPVVVSFGHATSSEKRVTEVHDTDNTAVSTNPSENTILLPGKDSLFRYTLTVNNDTDNTMTELILIDNLPEPGDHSPFDTNVNRNSAFKVSLAENPGLEVKVTPETGDPYVLAQTYYTVEYSTTTDFGGPQSNDWHGHGQNGEEGTTAVWTTNPTGARAIRVIIRDNTDNKIPSKAKVELSFNAKIDGEAEPAAVAWNSFGYHYHLDGVNEELEAMPLVVGIKVPSVPTLEKQLVDANGQPVTAEEEVKFSFLVYEGTALEGTYETEPELTAALNEESRLYYKFDLTVLKDQSNSGKVVLKTEKWKWITDKQYTITELPIQEDHYLLYGFNHNDAKTYTFTYNPGMQIPIICRNEAVCWEIQVIKKDGAGAQKPLAGAVFGLYSPNQTDMLQEIPEKYKDLGISQELTENGHSWYLKAIQTSNDNGEIIWRDLLEEKYYLLELKAPDGYKFPSPAGQVLYRTNAQKGVYSHSVLNYAGAALPETGGSGTLPFTAGGLLLIAAAVLMYGYRMRSRKEANTP